MHEFIEKADRDKILTALKLIMFFFVKFSFPPINRSVLNEIFTHSKDADNCRFILIISARLFTGKLQRKNLLMMQTRFLKKHF